MRRTIPRTMDRWRVRSGLLRTTNADGRQGAFAMPNPLASGELLIIASDAREPEAEGWEHVSVSTATRCPTWAEMCYIKNIWWQPEETVCQFHPPESQYVNNNRYVLHMWKPPYPVLLPPIATVGIPGLVMGPFTQAERPA